MRWKKRLNTANNMDTNFGDRKTAQDRLHGSKKSKRTMPPLSSKYPEKLRDAKKVARHAALLKKQQ